MGIELFKSLVSQGNSLEIKTKSVKLGLKIQVLLSIGYRNTYLSTCYTPSSAEDHITGSHVLFPMLSVYCILYLLSPLLPRFFSLQVYFSASFLLLPPWCQLCASTRKGAHVLRQGGALPAGGFSAQHQGKGLAQSQSPHPTAATAGQRIFHAPKPTARL